MRDLSVISVAARPAVNSATVGGRSQADRGSATEVAARPTVNSATKGGRSQADRGSATEVAARPTVTHREAATLPIKDARKRARHFILISYFVA